MYSIQTSARNRENSADPCQENVRDKVTSILYQNMNIQTNADNKRERWIIQVMTQKCP